MTTTMQGMVGTAAPSRSSRTYPVRATRDARSTPNARDARCPSDRTRGVSLARLCSRVPWFQTPVSVTLRPLATPDATAARALADALLGDAPYADAMLAALNEALTSASDEYRAIGVHDRNTLIGFVVLGDTAGAVGAGRIYAVGVDATTRRRGIGSALIDAACADLESRGARFAVIELPEEPDLAAGLALARAAGFREEGRVGDYTRDGVGLVLLRRDLGRR